jgi:hypothetical protein
MKICPWCGRENDNNQRCFECGTDLQAVAGTRPAQKLAALVTDEIDVDFSKLDLGYTVSEGFSRPDWEAIYSFVRENVLRRERAAAWTFIARIWLDELARNLGGDAKIRESKNFLCLSDLNPETTGALLTHAEAVLDLIRQALKKPRGPNSTANTFSSSFRTRRITTLTSRIFILKEISPRAAGCSCIPTMPISQFPI